MRKKARQIGERMPTKLVTYHEEEEMDILTEARGKEGRGKSGKGYIHSYLQCATNGRTLFVLITQNQLIHIHALADS